MEPVVGANVEGFVDECWQRVFSEVQGAAVYIDYAAAECLHWYAAGRGYLSLKAAGAITVQELAMYNFRYTEIRDCKKAVIVSTSNEPAFYQRTIKMIVAKNAFESCTILCAAEPSSINYESGYGVVTAEQKVNYAKLKRDAKDWMSSKKLTQEPSVNVVHVPIFVGLLNKDLLVTPPFGDLMPPLAYPATDELLAKANYLANSLHVFFEQLHTRRDVYAMGKLSEHIAEKMGNFAASERAKSSFDDSAAETSVSLILIDRTMDLCIPTSNNTESLLGKVLQTLPRLPHHQNDVAIDMSRICSEPKGVSRGYEIPGCLASLEKYTLDLLISKNPRKVLGVACQSLNELLSSSLTKESPRPRTTNRVTGHTLQKLVENFRQTGPFDVTTSDHREKLQMILAVLEASMSKKTAQLELLTSLEKLVLQNLSVSRESSSILAQLSNVIKTRDTRDLDIENLIALLIHVYALAGTEVRFSSQQETALLDSIADAVLEDAKRFNENPPSGATTLYQRTLLLSGTSDVAVPNDASKRIAARILDVLRSVSTQRSLLLDYRFFSTKPTCDETLRCIGILEQLVTHIFCTENVQDFRDLRQRSSSFAVSSFNLFARGRAKRHPRDNPWLFVYVVGGVTPEEAKRVQDVAVTHRPTCRVTLAGSRLLNPLDIADKILWGCILQGDRAN